MNEDKKLNGFNNGRDTTEGVGGQEPFWVGELSQPKLKAVKTAEDLTKELEQAKEWVVRLKANCEDLLPEFNIPELNEFLEGTKTK